MMDKAEEMKRKSYKPKPTQKYLVHSNWDSFYNDPKGNFLRALPPYSIFPFSSPDCIRLISGHYLVKTFFNIVKLQRYLQNEGWEIEDFTEKESGKFLKDSFNLMGKELKVTDKYKKFMDIYYEKGGKKNRATISKIMDSRIISWKSFIFLMFELLDNDEVIIEVSIKNVHGKVTDHRLVVKKND